MGKLGEIQKSSSVFLWSPHLERKLFLIKSKAFERGFDHLKISCSRTANF